MTRTIGLAFCLLAAATVCSCGRSHTPADAIVLRRGLGGEPASLDPAGSGDTYSFQVIEDLYEGLTAESSDGSVVPAVASSWSVDSTGTVYTFRLRPEARWSNGKPVRAQDFVAAWRRVVDPKHDSPVADDLESIVGARAIIGGRAPPDTLGVFAQSDATLVVKLERPTPYLPQILAQSAAFPVYSEAAARSHTANGWVSNGPYVLAGWQPGTTLELVRNANYWDRANVQIPAVEYQFAPDDASQLARYRAGQVDVTDSVPANELPALRAEHSSELVTAPVLATAYFGLNMTAQPSNSTVALRKALAMAIDRQRLVDIQGLGQIGAYGLVPPGTWNYQGQAWPWAAASAAQRIAEARRLYAQAGFSAAAPLHLRLLFNANAGIKRMAILIAAMWKETLGIDTVLTEEEYRVFLQSRHDKSRWDVARLGWNADFNDASNFLDILRSHSVNNDMGYANPAFDALMERASAADLAQRPQLLQSAERLMLEDYPIIPLYYFVSNRLAKPYVRGAAPTPLDHLPSKALSMVTH